MRYPLVEGQGNFGNVDGDNAAAMRYTESRLTEVAQSLLEGLDENAVDFRPTYDGEDEEPVVLPAAFPNLLANGSSGIAVGMATSDPAAQSGRAVPGDRCADRKSQHAGPNAAQIRQGPGFPHGRHHRRRRGLHRRSLQDGPRRISRAGALVERGSRRAASTRSWSTEIPYQVQKSKLIERIAELIEQKKLALLDDVRDESAEDIRLVLVPKSRAVDAGIADGAAVPAQRSRNAHSP